MSRIIHARPAAPAAPCRVEPQRPAHDGGRRHAATSTRPRRRVGWLAAVLLAVLLPAAATEQIPDAILVDGQQRPLHSEPFGSVLDTPARWQQFRDASGIAVHGPCTANWRGYRAWWALRDGRLWLERMVYGACSQDPPEADLSLYFPGQKTPIAADWYSGTLVIPLGQQGDNQHMGYSTQYPRYRLVEIVAGRVDAQREIDHEQLLAWRQQQRRHD